MSSDTVIEENENDNSEHHLIFDSDKRVRRDHLVQWLVTVQTYTEAITLLFLPAEKIKNFLEKNNKKWDTVKTLNGIPKTSSESLKKTKTQASFLGKNCKT